MGEFYIGLCFHGSISFMINVHIRGSIQATRGLHQGCPLSPYLFLNCANAFSCMLYAAELTRLIWRVRFSSDIWVSHLLFPDTLRGLRYAGGDFFSSFNGFRSNLVTRNLIFHSVHMWHLLFGWRLRIYLGLLRSLLLIGSWIYLQWSGGSGGLFPMNSNFRWIKNYWIGKWQEWMSSCGGKEVLIKAVGPAYLNVHDECFPITCEYLWRFLEKIHIILVGFDWIEPPNSLDGMAEAE